jgi:serine/threonine protein kinase
MTRETVVVKFNRNLDINMKEYNILQYLTSTGEKRCLFPTLIGGGVFSSKNLTTNSEESIGFIVLERYDKSLLDIFIGNKKAFSLNTVCLIGIQMIEALEAVHQIGFIHNDLKPNNILIDNKRKEKLILIDFGVSRPYLDSDGQHVSEGKTPFQGNVLFCSANSMRLRTLSRRDDLISLAYNMIYLVTGNLSYLLNRNTERYKDFNYMRKAKEDATPETLCIYNAKPLLMFVNSVFAIQFQERPDYDKLIEILHHVMMVNYNKIDFKMDWMSNKDLENSCTAMSNNSYNHGI